MNYILKNPFIKIRSGWFGEEQEEECGEEEEEENDDTQSSSHVSVDIEEADEGNLKSSIQDFRNNFKPRII